MTIASYGQAVTSAGYHHLATSVLLLPCRTLRSWTTGAWEPLKILFNSALALAVPAVVSRKVVV